MRRTLVGFHAEAEGSRQQRRLVQRPRANGLRRSANLNHTCIIQNASRRPTHSDFVPVAPAGGERAFSRYSRRACPDEPGTWSAPSFGRQISPAPNRQLASESLSSKLGRPRRRPIRARGAESAAPACAEPRKGGESLLQLAAPSCSPVRVVHCPWQFLWLRTCSDTTWK